LRRIAANLGRTECESLLKPKVSVTGGSGLQALAALLEQPRQMLHSLKMWDLDGRLHTVGQVEVVLAALEDEKIKQGQLQEIVLDKRLPIPGIPIFQLIGTDPVASIDLRNRGLGSGVSTILIGRLIELNAGSLTSINLSDNIPYGSSDVPAFAKALVDGGAFRNSLTEINLQSNDLGPEGAKAPGRAISVSKSLKE
jgi:hypothetical protein